MLILSLLYGNKVTENEQKQLLEDFKEKHGKIPVCNDDTS